MLNVIQVLLMLNRFLSGIILFHIFFTHFALKNDFPQNLQII